MYLSVNSAIKIAVMYIVLLTCLSGCVDLNEYIMNDLSDDVTTSLPISLKDAVYHEGADAWIAPRADPYTLENFQNAYNNLYLGKSVLNLTHEERNKFNQPRQLKATHYALRIFPKNEDEQWEIERMEDVKVAYVPFDYVQLADVDMESMSNGDSVCSKQMIYPESSVHTITYENVQCIGGPTVTETFILPVLYVVWPCDKPLPDNIEYEIDYEVFIPFSPVRTKNMGIIDEVSMRILEEEAIALALGASERPRVTTKSNPVITLKGRSVYYDTFIKKHIPQKNLKIKFQLGSNIWETYTQSDGSFSITQTIPTDASVSVVYQHPRWKITRENSTAPHATSFGTVSRMWGDDLSSVALFYYGSNVPANALHSAIDFYYNGSHSIRTWHYSDDGIRVIAMERTDQNANAAFYYSPNSRAYIKVYKNYLQNSNYLAGSILHEFGHFTHFGERGGYTGSAYNGFTAVHNLIVESFSSYVGYYLTETYYKALGFTKPYDGYNLCNQGRQSWTKSHVGNMACYSPLFVDLIDNYNQGASSSNCPNDKIKNVPHSVMRRIAQEVTTWDECKAILREYIGTFYTNTEFNNYIAAFDYWFAMNE